MRSFSVICIVALSLLGVGAAEAQTLGMGRAAETPSNMAAYYYYARTGDVTMNVGVWGTVRHPGQYEIRDGTDLGTLLSLAGGPALAARRHVDRREITISVLRAENQERTSIFESRLEELVASPQAYPMLRHGDVVMVETVERIGFSWRDVIPIVGAAAAVAVAIERFVPR